MVAGKATPDGKSLPVDYELEGTLLAPVRLGQQLVVFRHNRNGVAALGIFCSSPVEEIMVVTGNSVYRLTAAGPSATCP
ncbi:MAG: hypothetical protein Q7S40_02275 [Opitutaceae bacterium]|nr:hypothetical protein [Opitutaceae bacterium]